MAPNPRAPIEAVSAPGFRFFVFTVPPSAGFFCLSGLSFDERVALPEWKSI